MVQPNLDKRINLAPKTPTSWTSIALSIAIPLIVLLVMIIGAMYYADHIRNQSQQQIAVLAKNHASISGSIDFNGYTPSNATITISERISGGGSFTPVVTGLDPIDGEAWVWNNAVSGVAYDLQASLIVNGNAVATSQILTVAAPASSEVLRIVSTLASPNSTAQISGSIDLNGYIPVGSTIAIGARQKGTQNYTIVASGIFPQDGATWSWANAVTGTTYEVVAYLQQNGTTLSQSPKIVTEAPAENEVLVLNSTAVPPQPAIVTVSGSFNINGVIPPNSSVSLGVRPTGTSQFNIVASNLPANNGGAWSWSGASSGTSYDFQAYVVTNGGQTNISSQILTTNAPAANEILTINAPNIPPAPTGTTMTNTCVGKNPSTNLWQVQFNFNTNYSAPGVQQYLFTVGNNNGGNQFVNNTITPSNMGSPNQSQSYTSGFVFTEGQTYYAQWAYATCANCNTFSNFSPSLQFYCTTPVPTNTPTATPVPTNTPIPSNTPIPTPTNTPIPTDTPTPTVPPVPTNGLLK